MRFIAVIYLIVCLCLYARANDSSVASENKSSDETTQDDKSSQETTEATSNIMQRRIGDFMPMPYQGLTYAFVEWDQIRSKISTLVTSGGSEVPLSNATINYTELSMSFLYGITDRLAVGLTQGYVPRQSTQISWEGNGQVDTYQIRGLEDTRFGIKYRLVEQRVENGISVDVQVSYSPKSQTAKDASQNVQGNVARGGDQTKFGIALGKKFRGGQFSIGFEGMSASSAISENAENAQKTETDGNSGNSFSINGLVDLSCDSSLFGTLTYSAGDGYGFKSDDTKFTVSDTSSTAATIGMQFLPSTAFAINATITSVRYSSYNLWTSSLKLKKDNLSAVGYGLALLFAF